MKYFDLLNTAIEPLIFKEQNEIINEITTISDLTEKTAKKRLDNFNDILQIGSDNPAFTVLCDKPEIPKELWPICRKMAHFVLSERYIVIGNKTHSRETEIHYIEYYYEIPLLFMPVLISFVNAIQKKRPGKNPVASFFENMDVSLTEYSTTYTSEKYSCGSTEILIDIYKDWTTTYLGRSYFIHLEELLNECAESQYQREHLLNATMQLTAMAAPPISYHRKPSEQDMAKLDRLLTKFKANVAEEIKKRQSIDSLYANQEVVHLNSERTCIDDICNQLKKILKESAIMINNVIIQEHKPGSLYMIAVKNPESIAVLENQISESLSDGQTKIEEIIQNYYMNLEAPEKYNDGPLQSLYDSKKIFLNKENNAYKKDTLSLIFQNAIKETSRNLKEFFKDVRVASGDNPSRFNADRTEERLKKIWITGKIEDICKITIEKIDKANLPESRPSLYRPILPCIYQIGYPYGTDVPLPSDSTQSAEKTSIKE